MQVSRKLAWPLAAAVSATVIAGWSATVPATAAEASGTTAVEDFSYPGAAQILADRGITLKSGDGHIVLADCASGSNLVQLFSRVATPSEVCFQVTGPTGYLSLEIPQVYNIKGDDHAIKATLNTAGTVSSVDVPKNTWTPVGEGNTSGATTLLELNATDGPAVTAPTNATPAIGTVTIGQPGHPGSRACTGTLIATQWVLSAASCFADDPANPTLTAGPPAHAATVVVGGNTRTVTTLVPRTDRDLVLARLSAPIVGVTPAGIGSTAATVGQSLQDGGFGRTATAWVPATAHVGATTVTAVADTTLTATPATGTVCKGDAGGPAFTTDANGAITLTGVQSLSGQAGCLSESSSSNQVTDARVDNIAAWITANTPRSQQTPGDFNGSGRAGAAMAYRHSNGQIGFYTSLTDTAGNFGAYNVGYTVPVNGNWDWNSLKFVSGDFNGDGRSDLAMMYRHSDGSIGMYTGLADGNGLIQAFTGSYTVPASANWDWNAIQLFAGDFNGSGRSGVVMAYHRTSGEIGFYTSLTDTAGNFGAFNLGYSVPAGNWDWNSLKLVAGDFNGDGRSDLAMMYHHGDNSFAMYTGLADGNGLIQAFTGSYTVPASANWDWNSIQLLAGDFNGSGRSGVAMAYRHSNGQIGFYTSLTDTAGNFGAYNVGYTVPVNGNWDFASMKLISGDFNGDGRSDLAMMYHHGDGSIAMYTGLADAGGLIQAFTGSYTVPANANWDWSSIALQ
ncbi:hypothetical protein GCM10009665_21900 [Kitasatospora nipponensis]|uniref:Peptidase S1 domain-containing protein n=1 Tax=Kitasatospora nipponensis TaxID=258049 RepID=A0ABP4GN25_9ACTN